jgi:hypothetical protein
MPPRRRLTFATVLRIAREFPGVSEGTSYGTPALRAGKNFMARMKEDGETLVVKCGFDERDLRMQADRETFFTTDHYRGYPSVLVRLSRVSERDLRDVLEVAWRHTAPKKFLALYKNKT